MNYLNFFPNSDEEKRLIEFIAMYQYLPMNDVHYFFKSKKYFRNRVSNLISKKLLRKIKSNLVLGELGIEYAKQSNFNYTRLNRNAKYLPILEYISSLGAFYHNSRQVKFTPSYAMKDKEMFTITARKFIGIFNISGIEYLTYHISKEHDNKYVMSVIYDIQKEKKYGNILIFVDELSMIKTSDFVFGMNQVLIIEDIQKNREKLQYLNNMNWHKAIQNIYKDKVYLAEYSFCDYTDHKDKFVSVFYTLDTEKVNRIKYFLTENKDKNMQIVCSKELQADIQKELLTCKYEIIELEDYIEKECYIYD